MVSAFQILISTCYKNSAYSSKKEITIELGGGLRKLTFSVHNEQAIGKSLYTYQGLYNFL